MAASFLVQAGHRAIGLLAGPQASFSGRCRTEGFHTALTEAGLPWHPGWQRHCPSTVEGGRQATLSLLTEYPELTALFCFDDLVAVGALQACAQMGRTVPTQMAVVGFDDIELAALVTPALTTCRVPIQEIGEQALRLLLDRFNGSGESNNEVVLCPELVVRASAPGVLWTEPSRRSETNFHRQTKEVRRDLGIDQVPM